MFLCQVISYTKFDKFVYFNTKIDLYKFACMYYKNIAAAAVTVHTEKLTNLYLHNNVI